ncbi:MAG: hypothetical protein JNG90_19100 [Planctomycetaceae bacterium]|nr:hypothetical protein [Planctomycetaceae bacterium]
MTPLRISLRAAGGLALAALMLVGSAPAADENVDPAGQWKLNISTPDGQTLEVLVTLKKDGDKLVGNMVGSDAVETELKDVSFEDGELAFKLSRDFGGTPLESSFKGKLTADAFDGNVDYDVGGQTGTAKVDGKRFVEPADIKGAWKFTIKTDDGQSLEPIVKIEQDGETVSGTFLGMDGTEVKLEDGAFKDNELAFKVTLDFGGQELIAKFAGKVAAKEFKGKVDYDIGGQTGTFDVLGAKEAGESPIHGNWTLVATSEGGTFEPKLMIVHEGDKIEGVYVWDEQTKVDIKEPKLSDKELTFKVEHDFSGSPIVVLYSVTTDGDSLKGKADYDLGGQTGTATIEGKRVKPAEVAGTWNISLTTEDGQSFDVTLKLEQGGDGLKGTYTGPAGEAEIKDAKVDGNKIEFSVVRERDGQEFEIEYEGTIDGDAIKGEAEADFGGQEMTLKFEGKRAK